MGVAQQAALSAAAFSPASAGENSPGARAKVKAATNNIINSFFMTLILIFKCKSTIDAVLSRHCYRICWMLKENFQQAF